MPHHSAECLPIAEAIKGLERERSSFEKELRHAESGAKPFLISQINRLNSQIDQDREKLEACKKEHPLHA